MTLESPDKCIPRTEVRLPSKVNRHKARHKPGRGRGVGESGLSLYSLRSSDVAILHRDRRK